MLNWLGLSSDKLYLYPMNQCNFSLGGGGKIILKINNLIKLYKRLSKPGKNKLFILFFSFAAIKTILIFAILFANLRQDFLSIHFFNNLENTNIQ